MVRFFLLPLFFVLIFIQPSYAGNFWKKTPAEIDSMLVEIKRKYPDFERRVNSIARNRIGTPYKLGPLGEKGSGNPVFTASSADCTVFVLTTLALAEGGSYRQAGKMMEKLNYYNPPRKGYGPVSYGNRIHFTYDRLHSSTYFSDITELVAPSSSLVSHSMCLNVKSDGSELLPVSWKKNISGFYIPMSKLNESVLAKLPDSCGVGFIRRKNFDIGVFISHEGIVAERNRLIQADSVKGRVVEGDLLEYCRRNSDYFDGVVFYSFNF